jgi:hypothetical protein
VALNGQNGWLAGLAEAFLELPTISAVLDGELCICDDRGRPDFRALHAEMRQSRPDVSRMAFFAFDVLFQDSVDPRSSLSFTERQRDLKRLCNNRRRVPCLYLVETFPEGGPLLEWCANYGLEGIVSKLRTSGYGSGPCRHWVKTKCPNWKRENAERHRLFEDPPKSAISDADRELKKKREELRRVMERLQGPDLSHGMARELRTHVETLEREIGELE